MRPGPEVAATAPTLLPSTPASTRASATTGVSSSTWARLATSGTTPPKRECRSVWLLTTEDSTSRPSTTTAAAVSSHEVSMPSTRQGEGTSHPPSARAAPALLEWLAAVTT